MGDLSLAFVAIGTPAAQGSKNRAKNGHMYEANEKLPAWRDTVAWSARAARPVGWTPLEGPVHLAACFTMKRPKALANKPQVSYVPNGLDLDKQLRALGDALTMAGVWCDDRQVARVYAVKVYAASEHRFALDVPGVSVVVSNDPGWWSTTWRDAMASVAADACRGVGVGGAE